MSGLTTTFHLAISIQSLTGHLTLMQGLVDLPACLFDAGKCDIAETVLRRVLTPVLIRTFPELQEIAAEDIKINRVLVRLVVDLQSKGEIIKTLLQAKVKAYQEGLQDLGVNKS